MDIKVQKENNDQDYILKELQLRTRSSVAGQLSLLVVFCLLVFFFKSFTNLFVGLSLIIFFSNLFRFWVASKQERGIGAANLISAGIIISAIGWGVLLYFSIYQNRDDSFIYLISAFIVAGLTSGSLFSIGISKRDFSMYIFTIFFAFNLGMLQFVESKISFSVLLMSILFIPFLLKQRSIYYNEFMLLFRTNQILEEQQLQLVHSAKMAALGEMSGGIAHEINNPLTIIIGKAQLLKKAVTKFDDDESSQKMNSLLSDIQHTAHRIAIIVKGLKSFARDAGQDPFISTSINQIIDETLAFCEARIANHSIELRKINISNTCEVECRPAQISQVLLNALNNSFDAVEIFEKKWIEIEVIELESTVKILITDCGLGIPIAVREKLMNPFFTTKEVGKGTGLGLSLSRGIIDSHRGKFNFDFDYKNTRIIIELPKKHNREKDSFRIS